MSRYHVEFEVESDEEWEVTEAAWYLDVVKDGFGRTIVVPADALISDITPAPKLEAGWYQFTEGEGYVQPWSEYELEGVDPVKFLAVRRRVKDPEPYEVQEDHGYKDGYYQYTDEDFDTLYRLADGKWTFRYTTGAWAPSQLSDYPGHKDNEALLAKLVYLGTEEFRG